MSKYSFAERHERSRGAAATRSGSKRNIGKRFCESIAGRSKNDRSVHLFAYSLQASRAVDVLDVARTHQCSTARRNWDWEFIETPKLRQVRQEIKNLNNAIDILSKPFPGHGSLTPRERVALAQIVRGASNKDAARTLGISPRTVEFHRANVMRKLGAKNIADLVRRVLSE
jgi:DNA-binding CsgD family transcriptional regulator